MVLNLFLGVAALGYGLYTAYVRATSPEKLAKLSAMKQQWGDSTGLIGHVVAYTIIPLLVGVILIVSAL